MKSSHPLRRSVSRAAALLAAITLSACGRDAGEAGPEVYAAELGEPHYPMPQGELTDQDGAPFLLASRTRGTLTYVSFGYTYCPDICPITMMELARARALLTPEERDRTSVVFISVDPQRDTPERLEEWLGAIDSAAVGLTGPTDRVDAVLGQLGFIRPPSEIPVSGDYEVAHPAMLFVFTPDGFARYGYLPDTATPAQMAEDARAVLAAYP